MCIAGIDRLIKLCVVLGFALGASVGAGTPARAEPDPSTYMDVATIRPGMKGEGWTVLVGTTPEKFGAEVLGVLKDVSPGRDMVLCRLTGCNLEHAGIIQGMSGSPIYIDGKLLGAVAFAWEFAKDPIAGVTPFAQMVQYVRSSDKRVAAEEQERKTKDTIHSAATFSIDRESLWLDTAPPIPVWGGFPASVAVGAGGLAGMKAIATPLAARGFTANSLALLDRRLGPLGMAPMAGGGASEDIIKQEGDKPFVPGAPLSIAMVTGDFDISGIGTVTHVEGNRVYGFGHPMFALGKCDLPLMTGYIHTVYPRASVSMKMGSPLKVVGVMDTDVSTGVAGRIGPKPDMLPLTVRVKVGAYSEAKTYHVQIVREPNLLPSLVLAVLSNAIDTEGNLPEEFSAHVKTKIALAGQDPIVVDDVLSGPRFAGPMGPSAMFGMVSSIVNLLSRNDLAPVRIESIDSDLDVTPGRLAAQIESFELVSDRVEPGQTLQGSVTIKPFKGDRVTIAVELPLPIDISEGVYEVQACDMTNSLRRTLRNEPELMGPRDTRSLLELIRLQVDAKHSTLNLHVALPNSGLAIEGQALPNLPGSIRSVFANSRQSPKLPVRTDLIKTFPTHYALEGTKSLRFHVVKNSGVSQSQTP